DNWSEITKQSIFEAWVPYVSDRPLDFFVPRSDDGKEGVITNVIDDRTPLSEHRIVNTMKRRKVIILTSDELCQNYMISDVLVAKIISVKVHQRNQDFYKKYLINDIHPLYVH